MQILKSTLTGFECADSSLSGDVIIFTVGLAALNCLLTKTYSRTDTIPLLEDLPPPKNEWWPLTLIVYVAEMLALIVSQANYTVNVIEGAFITSTLHYLVSPMIADVFND